MAFLLIGKPKTIFELKSISKTDFIDRRSVKIAVIDDEPFIYKDILLRHDFDIREIGDPNDIKALEAYDIVLCDIKGVGKHFHSSFEGGHLIKEIKARYPSKIIVAYTGQQFDATYNQFYKISDFTLKKDISGDEWVDYLDKAVKQVVDPMEQWVRLRKLLIKHEVSSLQLMYIEDGFVKKHLGQDDRFPSGKVLKLLAPELKAVLNGFVANLIFKAVVG